MSKILLITMIVLYASVSFGQGELFEFSETIQEDSNRKIANITGSYVVLKINGSENELYKLTRDWVNETFNDPETVIISDTDSNYLKIKGSSDNVFFSNAVLRTYYKNIYRLSFKFKENKIKMEINTLDVFEYIPKTYVTGDWKTKNIIVISKKNGKPIKFNVQEVERVKNYFNALAISLKNYNNKESNNKDDW